MVPGEELAHLIFLVLNRPIMVHRQQHRAAKKTERQDDDQQESEKAPKMKGGLFVVHGLCLEMDGVGHSEKKQAPDLVGEASTVPF